MNRLCIPIEHCHRFRITLNIIVVSYRKQITIELMSTSRVYTGFSAGQIPGSKILQLLAF